ncbi:hypothetical protein L2E82_01609 [Cichorium intybus]|uniref:Uncharacterized protein n=1 Tax=Cichorium intybus TaxID=13427 RepID=A0ACB9H0N0_CICIN|nr:hypothetical protein L2E82_01609 [Cichorium intybus]
MIHRADGGISCRGGGGSCSGDKVGVDGTTNGVRQYGGVDSGSIKVGHSGSVDMEEKTVGMEASSKLMEAGVRLVLVMVKVSLSLLALNLSLSLQSSGFAP